MKTVKKGLAVIVSLSCFICSFMFGFFDLEANAFGGNTYYVAENGSSTNDGFSSESPLSYQMASSMVFSGGDQILFQRGDVFYGSFSPNITQASPENCVVAGAYGTGALPRLSLAKIINQSWINAGNGFYKYDISAGGIYGGVQNANTNVGFIEDESGNKWGVRKENASACVNAYDFYCDSTHVYLKTVNEPYQNLGSLTLSVDGSVLRAASNLVVQDIHIQYSAGHGISLQNENSSYITIRDCVIEDIGGGRLGTTGWTKYGNGIELYGGASHITVERNIIRNIYDVGFTLQGGGTCVWKDITVKNNVFAYNTQACEIWTSNSESGKGVNDFDFSDNLCINQGKGWGTLARPDLNGSTGQVKMADILIYGYDAPIFKMSVNGNVFFNTDEANRVYSVSSVGGTFLDFAQINNNFIYLPNTTSICMSTDNTTGKYGSKSLTFSAWKSGYAKDLNSSFTAISGSLSVYASMQTLAMTGMNVEDIFVSANTVGINGISLESSENLLEGKTPSAVKLEKSATYTYSEFTSATLRTSGPPLSVASDGNTTNRIWFDLSDYNERDNYVMGLLYDLGGYYDVNSAAAYFPTQDALKGYVEQFTVYGGLNDDSSILNNPILRVQNENNSIMISDEADSFYSSARYVLVVFDEVPTLQGVNGAMGNGTIYLSEIEVSGTAGSDPDAVGNILTGILPDTVMLDPSTTFDYTGYESTTFRTNNGIAVINDGNQTNRTWFDIFESADRNTHVSGLLYDLGGYYNIVGSSAYFPAQDAAKGFVQQYSVYGGISAGPGLLDNLLVRVNNTNNSTAVSGNVSAPEGTVRYLLVVFDTVPTVEGVNGSMGNDTIYMSELEVSGSEGNPANLLFDLTPTTVQLDKSPAYTYTAFEQSSFRMSSSGLSVINDGDETNRTWFDLSVSGDRNTHVMGLLYDLGGYYSIDSAAAFFPAQDAAKGYVQQFTVYGGLANDNTLLNTQIARVANSNNSTSVFQAAGNPTETVRYVLVVFDLVPTLEGVNGSMGNGTVYISELGLFS